MSKFVVFPVAILVYVTHTVFTGILSPLFGDSPEDRPKNISTVPVAAERNTQDVHCRKTYLPHSEGIASWYGPGFHGRIMANGKPYNMHGYTVAHKTLRLGTEVCITNPKNGRSVRATVTDRGPYISPRIVDLSRRIADDLDLTIKGVGNVEIATRSNK